jgi:hypothetical protein
MPHGSTQKISNPNRQKTKNRSTSTSSSRVLKIAFFVDGKRFWAKPLLVSCFTFASNLKLYQHTSSFLIVAATLSSVKLFSLYEALRFLDTRFLFYC